MACPQIFMHNQIGTSIKNFLIAQLFGYYVRKLSMMAHTNYVVLVKEKLCKTYATTYIICLYYMTKDNISDYQG